MKINIKFLSIFLLSQLLVFSSVNFVKAENILASDDFNDENDEGWIRYHESGNSDYSNQWSFLNGMYGLKIDSSFVIENSLWGDNQWTDYEVSFDMLPLSGADKNFILRYQDRSHQNTFNRWYEIHISGTTIHLTKIGYGDIAPAKNISINNGSKYNWKARLIGNKISVYYKKDNDSQFIEIFDIEDQTLDPILNGKIGIRIGTGSAYPTEIYFDNIVVTDLSPNKLINIPHLSQIDPIWKDTTYDHAESWAPTNISTIKDWGCALTSASMILNYYGFPNNPQTLNQYLIDKHGYNAWGGVIWSYFTKYAKEAKDNNSDLANNQLLEFSYPIFSQQILDQDLANNQPSILKLLTHPEANGYHFVVFTGQNTQGGNNLIHDPLTLAPTPVSLSAAYPSITPIRIARFTPSNTDLSYIWVYTDPGVNHLNITNLSTSGEEPFDLIESESIYAPSSDTSQPHFNTYFKAKPTGNQYRITATTTQADNYTIEVDAFDRLAANQHQTFNLFISPNISREIVINYDPLNAQNTTIKPTLSLNAIQELLAYDLENKLISPTLHRHFVKMLNLIQKQLDKNNQTAATSIKQALIAQIHEALNSKKLQPSAYTQLLYELSL